MHHRGLLIAREALPAPSPLEPGPGPASAIILDFPARRVAAPDLRPAIDALYRRHNDTLLKFLKARLRSEADAHEAAQEAYARLIQLNAPPTFLKAYLFRIGANVATDIMRRRRSRAAGEADVAAEDEVLATQERVLIARQQLGAVMAALKVLPAPCRAAFELDRLKGWSTLRIAQQLGVSDRTARRYLVQARERLQAAADGAPAPACRRH